MSFSRAKIARFNSKDAVSKESTTSTNSKLLAKPKNDKWAPPKCTKPKLPRPVRHRSLSQPSSTTALNTKSTRPRSVDNNHVMKQDSSKADLDKNDDDTDFYSTTVLHMPELSKIDEDSKNSTCPTLDTTTSETKSNISGIPLRIKSSQVNNKEIYKSPRDNKKLTSNSCVSNSSKINTPKRDSRNSNIRVAPSNTLLSQFETKKKRLLMLKEELTAKQQLMSESYKILVELKKKLDRSGVGHVVLQDLEMEPSPTPVDPHLMESMKLTLNEIPLPLIDLCKELMNKRKMLVSTLEDYVQSKITPENVEKCLQQYKNDTNTLEKEMLSSCEGQQSLINRLIHKWSILSSNAGDASNIVQQVEELQAKLKEQEHKLDTVTRNLQNALEQNETYEKKTHQAESIVAQLKEKIKILEHDLMVEKNASQSHKDKFSANDQKLKSMKSRIQELETKCKETDCKYNELQKSCKHAQDQIKTNEHRWLKEKEDLLSKNKHDKQMLEKLTKDRSCFETRMKCSESKLKENLEEARKLLEEEKCKKETLQEKYDQLHKQLVELEIRNKQTMDVVNTKHTYEPREAENITTEREVELYTELLATRVGLKAAEEKLQNYHREKMRFLDTIQLLQGEHSESISTLQNMQRLTEMEETVNEKDEIIYKQKIEISNLKSEIEHLKLKEKSLMLNENKYNEEESELKLMLREGKTRIEQLIKKSSENEQKAISYKYDLDKRNKQLCEMENLLKAREELLTVMKLKKDELQIENNSLNKYANEIRELLIQSREEARNRNELVQELTMNLETKGRACEQLEKMIKDLEYSLSITNEKRFKLQESIGAMEKELQSTKAHIINMAPEAKNNWYGINNSPRNLSGQKSPRNRYSFTYTQNTANLNGVNVYSHAPSKLHPRRKPTITYRPKYPIKNNCPNLNAIPSNSSCNSENNTLDSNAIKSWLSSYENIEDIQKRLKFLKRAFNSLSQKMQVQDRKLKHSPLQYYANDISNNSRTSKQLMADRILFQKRPFSPISNAQNRNKYWTNPQNVPRSANSKPQTPLKPDYPSEHLHRSAINVSHQNSAFLPKKVPSPITYNKCQNAKLIPPQQSSLDALRDRHFKQHLAKTHSPTRNICAKSKNSSLSSILTGLSYSVCKPNKVNTTSSIPVPKPRYSPLTLPTGEFSLTHEKRFHGNNLENISCKKCSQIPIPKQIYPCPHTTGQKTQTTCHKACLYLPLNRSNDDYFEYESCTGKRCPSRSYLLYTNSNISTYENTKKHLEQIRSLTKTTPIASTSQSSENMSNFNLLKSNNQPTEITSTPTSPKYATFESSCSDSGKSNMSISTVIKCSHLFNNLSKNYSDLLISRKQYVLKLFMQKNQNVHSESDISDRRGCVIENETKIIDNGTFAQSLHCLLSLPSGLE